MGSPGVEIGTKLVTQNSTSWSIYCSREPTTSSMGTFCLTWNLRGVSRSQRRSGSWCARCRVVIRLASRWFWMRSWTWRVLNSRTSSWSIVWCRLSPRMRTLRRCCGSWRRSYESPNSTTKRTPTRWWVSRRNPLGRDTCHYWYPWRTNTNVRSIRNFFMSSSTSTYWRVMMLNSRRWCRRSSTSNEKIGISHNPNNGIFWSIVWTTSFMMWFRHSWVWVWYTPRIKSNNIELC